MISKDKKIKIWYLLKKIALKKGIVDISEETKQNFWEMMKFPPEENIRYLVINLYNLDVDFFFREYEETELKGLNEQTKIKELFEGFSKGKEDWEELLLIDVKTLKGYTLKREIKYIKKLIC